MLLILDLDETLVHAAEVPPDRPADFLVGPYHVFRRPHLEAFLADCAVRFRLAFWSTGGEMYVQAIVGSILPDGVEPVFAWGRGRCVRRFDPERLCEYHVKDLKKVRRLGFDLRRVLVVYDTPRKVERHYGNAIYVPPYGGEADDEVLPRLARYLETLADVPDVRSIEKRRWERRIP